MSVCVLGVVVLFSIGAGPRSPAVAPSAPAIVRDRTPGLDVLHYELDLTILPATQELHGTAVVTMQSAGEPLASIPLDLVGLTVSGVMEGEDSVRFDHSGGMLALHPAFPLEPYQPRTFSITYGGHPGNEGGASPWGGFFFTGSMAYSVGVGLYADPPSMGRYWFPGHDVPSDKATSEVTLRVPEGWIGVSNGSCRFDTTEDGVRVTRWGTDLPIATYLMAVAGGPYVELADSAGTVPIRHYVLPSQADRARASFVHVPQMIDLFSRLFGPYPFERFGYVSSNLAGGMEHQTMVTLGAFAINGLLTWEPLIAHELSHQWWGDLVTYADWTQVWVSEGFATYCEALWAEENGGTPAYVASVNQMMLEYLGSGESYFPLNDPDVLWGSATYEKGACVLHMLRQTLGDSLFFAGLARLRADHGYGNATTDSVETAFEAATGQDLTWFFDQWVRSPGHPELAFRYATFPYADGDTGVEIEVRQLQATGPVFRFPFEVACTTPSGSVRASFLDSLPVQVGSFRIPGEVTGLAVDPDRDLLFRNLGVSPEERLELASWTVEDDGDGDGGLDVGEDASVIVGIRNPFSGLNTVMLEAVCADPGIIIVDGIAQLDSVPAGMVTRNDADPFRLRAAEDAPPHAVELSLRVTTASGGEITIALPLQIGTATRLLVDDSGPGNSYASYFLAALDTLPDGADRELWETHRQGTPTAARLAKYADRGMVTWFTGDVASTALDEGEIAGLHALLAAGGRLFLTGQNAVDDLSTHAAGQAFLDSCLKISVLDGDFSATRAVMGEEGDPVGNGVSGVIQGNGGANNQTSLTGIAALEGAFPVLHYRNTAMDCAVRTTDPGRVVVFSFGFEALNETQPQFTSRAEMIRRVADWLEGPGTGTADVPHPAIRLWAPNPWHQTGRVRLWLPEPATVRIALYDMGGREARTVHRGMLPEGFFRFGLPDGISPGAYLVVARTETQTTRAPVIIIP